MRQDVGGIDILVPHFKRRLSGVTSTVIALVPKQVALGQRLAILGPGLPKSFPSIGWPSLLRLWRSPPGGRKRVWHARRNLEMLGGVILRDVFRMKLKLLFTSAAQRRHTSYTRFLIGRMDAVIATSPRSGSFLKVPHTVISHGVDLDLFRPPVAGEQASAEPPLPGRHLVGCFGRVRHQKGTDLFVEAMIALLPHHPDWTAVISGRVTPEHADFAKTLEQKIAAAGLSERIRFLGEVDDIKPWYRRLDLYVAPSRNEGFGLTPLEAMASQTAVVASDAGSYPEQIVEGVTGTVVPAGDGAALTAAIEPWLADPDRTARAGHAALDHVRANFALEKEARAIGAIYAGLLGEKQMTPAQFLTCGKNLKAFARGSAGRVRHLKSGVIANIRRIASRKGPLRVVTALLGLDLPYPVSDLVGRNLTRRQIRFPAAFRFGILGFFYRLGVTLEARLQLASFEAALDQNPQAAVLVHNGFMLPHSTLGLVAERLKRPHVYTEGGFFPGTFQCDADGINYLSSLPRDPAFYRALTLSPEELAPPQDTVRRPSKLKGSGKLETLPERYIFVPFQVPSDMQILALSPWIHDMVHLYEVVHAAAERFPHWTFVIKEHPSFPLSVRDRVQSHPRILFANLNDTRELIEKSAAVLTVNSTVGLEAVFLERKVITLGLAHYNLPGLVTHAGDLEALFAAIENLDRFHIDEDLRRTFIGFVTNVFLRPGSALTFSEPVLDAIRDRAYGTDRYSSLTRHP